MTSRLWAAGRLFVKWGKYLYVPQNPQTTVWKQKGLSECLEAAASIFSPRQQFCLPFFKISPFYFSLFSDWWRKRTLNTSHMVGLWCHERQSLVKPTPRVKGNAAPLKSLWVEPVAGWVGEAGRVHHYESDLAWLGVIIPLYFRGELQLKQNITWQCLTIQKSPDDIKKQILHKMHLFKLLGMQLNIPTWQLGIQIYRHLGAGVGMEWGEEGLGLV